MKKLFRILWVYSRYEIPLWLMALLTDWMPDNRFTVRLRGWLYSLFIYQCGKNLTVAKWVQLKSTHKLVIGDNVYLASGVWINAMGGMTLEDEVVIGPFCVISTGIHQFKDDSVRFGGTIMNPITIGRGTWLASHVSVKAGVKIGPGVLVAANAAVSHDVEANVMVAGVPAKVIKKRENNDAPTQHSRFD